jgi:putative transcriptional regulator
MIRCHLGRLLGDRKLKIADVVRDTGINRGTLTRLYYETSERVELEALDRLCEYFGCEIEQLLEYVPDAASTQLEQASRSPVPEKVSRGSMAVTKRPRAR